MIFDFSYYLFARTTWFDTLYWSACELMTMRVYSSVAAIIYKKSLTLSANTRNQYSSGEVINLIAVDASKIQEALTYVTFLYMANSWSCCPCRLVFISEHFISTQSTI